MREVGADKSSLMAVMTEARLERDGDAARQIIMLTRIWRPLASAGDGGRSAQRRKGEAADPTGRLPAAYALRVVDLVMAVDQRPIPDEAAHHFDRLAGFADGQVAG